MSEPAWILPPEDEPPPAVSIIIPSHRAGMLHEAMASLEAQTCQDFQLLVNYEKAWRGDKINRIANASIGRFILILPDDDKLAPTYLEQTLAAAQGGFDIIYTDIQFFGDRTDHYDLPDFGINTFRHACVPWMTALIRRELWDELEGFDPEQLFQDSDFYLRCALREPAIDVAHVRERLVLARQHPGNGAKLMDHSAAALKLQAKHPAFYPSQFLAPPAPGAFNDGRAVVAPLAVPGRFQKLQQLAQAAQAGNHP